MTMYVLTYSHGNILLFHSDVKGCVRKTFKNKSLLSVPFPWDLTFLEKLLRTPSGTMMRNTLMFVVYNMFVDELGYSACFYPF